MNQPITACLLHADYHVMDADCWGVVLDWSDHHRNVPETARRDDYQAAVERRILNQLRAAAPVAPEESAATRSCPSDCDDDCEADCHEEHTVPWKRHHNPATCPSRTAGSQP